MTVGSTAAMSSEAVVDRDERRDDLRARGGNGLDTVELLDGRHLALTFLRDAPHDVTRANVRIEGPAHSGLEVLAVRRRAEDDPDMESQLVVELTTTGRPGPHRLALVEPGPHGRPSHHPLRTLDPLFTEVTFSFDIDQINPVRGLATRTVGAISGETDEVPYLARDFAGLREVLLDRLATLSPGSIDRHLPDIGMMLVELFAYAGDDLSYYQDAVATEAYVRTARRRISVRRHARLVGYRMHEGCSARAWLFLDVDRPVHLPLAPLLFTTAAGPAGPCFSALLPTSADHAADAPDVRDDDQPGLHAALRPDHNQIRLWHWGRHTCDLPAGATAATFLDAHFVAEPAKETTAPSPAGQGADAVRPLSEPPADTPEPTRRVLALRPGDILLFEQILDREGGPPEPSLRHPVRLLSVRATWDPLYDVPLVAVTWAEVDALPFTLPIRAVNKTNEQIDCGVAHGNIVGAVHGLPVQHELDIKQRSLPDSGLGCAAEFPLPEVVARHQASVLRHLFDRWRNTVERWWLDAEHGQALAPDDLALLRAQIGASVADELGLTDSVSGAEPSALARALRRLLVQCDRLLAGRRRRLAVLARLAEASGPLGPTIVAELHDDWGPELVAGLDRTRPASWGPAAVVTDQEPSQTHPMLTLVATGQPDDAPQLAWTAVADLLNCDSQRRAVEVEMDDDRGGRLRFRSADEPTDWIVDETADRSDARTDGESDEDDVGKAVSEPVDQTVSEPTGPHAAEIIEQPAPKLVARYFIGGGVVGNVPAGAINVVTTSPAPSPEASWAKSRQWSEANDALKAVQSVRNPLAAVGGREPEDVAAVKRALPRSYLTDQPRALRAEDYARWAAKVEGVGRAAAALRWTGSGLAAEVAIQPTRGGYPDRFLVERVRRRLDEVRRIGHDLWIESPRYRPAVLAMRVELHPDAVRSEVRDALLALLSAGHLADGSEAFFHPRRLGFGQPVATSAVIATVCEVIGVESAVVTRFAFLDKPIDLTSTPASGSPALLTAGPLQIIRLDNDPLDPSNGYTDVELRGGR